MGDGLYCMCSSQIHRHKSSKRERERERERQQKKKYLCVLCSYVLLFSFINQCNEFGLNKDISIHLLSTAY